MAIHQATPTTIGAVAARALSGDIIDLTPGLYTTIQWVTGVTYRDPSTRMGRVVTDTLGHQGQGLPVRYTGLMTSSAQRVTIDGLFHDTSGRGDINAGVITGDDWTIRNSVGVFRPASGARQIGYTSGASITVNRFTLEACRIGPVGQVGNVRDHAIYLKNTRGYTIRDNIIVDGGRFPLHLYTNADGGLIERNIVWGGMGCIVISGATDASTGVAGYQASDNNRVTRNILGNGTYSRGYLIETQWEGGAPGVGNLIDDNIVTRGGGAAGLIEPGLAGVTITRMFDIDPGFRDWRNGDFRNATGYGPKYLTGTVAPPPPPPPPPPSEDPAVTALRADLAVIQSLVNGAQQELAAAQAALTTARGRIP